VRNSSYKPLTVFERSEDITPDRLNQLVLEVQKIGSVLSPSSPISVTKVITSGSSGGGAGITDHGVLSGLTDDDHTHYLLADGSRTLSAAWSAGQTIRATKFEVDGAGSYLDVDGSNNLIFVDAVTGSKTLAELAASASGEANTASNQGSGTSLFYQKSGVDLQFNGIKSENALLSIALDAVSHDVELTVNQGSIDHDALTNFVANEHIDWTSATQNLDTTGTVKGQLRSTEYVYPHIANCPNTYIKGVLNTTERLHLNTEAYISMRLGGTEKLVISSASIYTGTGISVRVANQLQLEDDTAYISQDVSNNLSFTDSVTGTKTLAQLAAGAGGAPVGAQYVTLAVDSTLTAERVLTAGNGIGLTDGGAGSTITAALTTLAANWDAGNSYTIQASKFITVNKEIRFTSSSGYYIYFNSTDSRFEFLDATDLPCNFKASTFIATDGELSSGGGLYFGAPSTNGTWLITRSGNDLIFQRRESGSYVTKETILA